jgi:hypothetical protein
MVLKTVATVKPRVELARDERRPAPEEWAESLGEVRARGRGGKGA